MSKVILDYGGALDYGVPTGTYYSDPAGEIATLTAKLEAAEKDVVRITAERDKAWTDGCNLLDTITEQAAQIESLEKDAARYREQEWQPIETAPKDGSKFIAWDSRHRMCVFDMRSNTDGDLCSDRTRWSGLATHWMPLPAIDAAILGDIHD